MSRSASAASTAFSVSVRGRPFRERRTTCMVSVLPPLTTRPRRRLTEAARARARGSIPGCQSKRRSSKQVIAALNFPGTDSATPNRHWPSAAIDAPRSSPSRSRTTVDSGSSKDTTGNSPQNARSSRLPATAARPAHRRTMGKAATMRAVSWRTDGERGVTRGAPAPRLRWRSRGWGTRDPREALGWHLRPAQGHGRRATALSRPAAVARTPGVSCYWPGSNTSTHCPFTRALRVASYIASAVTIGR